MKTRLLIFLAISTILTNFEVLGYGQPMDPSHSNYVVIGAFAISGHADIWVANAKKLNFTAVSAINPNRNLYYVYVMNTGDKEEAKTEANKLRKATPYWDTWVYSGPLGLGASTRGSDVHPVTGQAIATIETKDAAVEAQQGGTVPSSLGNGNVSGTTTGLSGTVTESAGSTSGPAAGTLPGKSSGTSNSTPGSGALTVATGGIAGSVAGDNSATTGSSNTLAGASSTAEKSEVEDAEEGSKNFLFRIFAVEDNQVLAGDIDVLDVDRGGRKVASYQGNQNVVLKPVNKSGNLSMICDVFGYRKLKVDLNFERPAESDGIHQEGNQTIVPFGLTRLKKGDISVMYNVYFFKDAAVMRPESRSEVNSLLAMMKGNPKYKIKIHGHTNGNSHGKVISMGESKKFFALTDTREGFGSAKKLSEERAKVIREYLVAEGIEANRMQIKAWGGKRPAVEDKMSPQAQSNVRVEIEILEDK